MKCTDSKSRHFLTVTNKKHCTKNTNSKNSNIKIISNSKNNVMVKQCNK